MDHEVISARLLMRPVSTSEIDALHELWTIPQVRRFLWDDLVVPRAHIEAIVAQSDESFRTFGYGQYGLHLLGEPGLVGFCGFRPFEAGTEIELLYALHPQCWGHGLATEAALALLQELFRRHEDACVIAATDTPNQGSVRVMQRLGMAFRERCEWRSLDTVFYTLTAPDLREFLDGYDEE